MRPDGFVDLVVGQLVSFGRGDPPDLCQFFGIAHESISATLGRGGAGYTRDLILMLIDVCAVLDHLYLDGTQPQITAPAEDYLRESASPYTLPALIDALSEVTGQLSHAERQALGDIPPGPPACQPARSNPAASF